MSRFYYIFESYMVSNINKLEDNCDDKWCHDFITYLKNIWSQNRNKMEDICDVK